MKRFCWHCKGRGWVRGEGTDLDVCPICKGKGQTTWLRRFINKVVGNGTRKKEM